MLLLLLIAIVVVKILLQIEVETLECFSCSFLLAPAILRDATEAAALLLHCRLILCCCFISTSNSLQLAIMQHNRGLNQFDIHHTEISIALAEYLRRSSRRAYNENDDDDDRLRQIFRQNALWMGEKSRNDTSAHANDS